MKLLLFFLTAGVLFCGGCAKQQVVYTKKLGFGVKDQKNYPKLKDYKLSLELSPGTRSFRAGAPGELIFILRNNGQKSLRINEWHKFEPNNLKVRCQVWLPGTEKPDPSMWLDVSAPVKKPVWRYPLVIGAGEMVFVSVQLDFLANLIVTPGSERRFFVDAKLNLNSVEAAAPTTYITILPGKLPKREKMPKKQIPNNK